MVTADPGSGKTTMVQALAERFKFTFLPYNLTQMIYRDEVLAIFDEISTRQAREPEQNFLVFVDEINADVDGGPVYGMFLTPLEDGTYAHRGRIFTIKPCVWIFAGTRKSNGHKTTNGGTDPKESDFYSRVTVDPKMDYESLRNKAAAKSGTEVFEAQTKLERVYLAAKLIRERWPDVEYVAKEVLYKFYDLYVVPELPEKPLITVRDIRKKVASFQNVQHGRVTRENWQEEHWLEQTSEDKTLVKLVFE